MAWRVARSVDHAHALDDLILEAGENDGMVPVVKGMTLGADAFGGDPLIAEHLGFGLAEGYEVLPIGGPGEERPIGRVYVVDGIAKLRPPVPPTGATSVVSV